MFFSLVPPPNILVTVLNNQQVGDPLLLECIVTTVRGITSSVDIVWSANDEEVRRASGVSGETVDNLVMYTSVHNVSSKPNGNVYSCIVVINGDSLSIATYTIGKNQSLIFLCNLYLSSSCYHRITQ